jgi:hypothetical protein
MTRVLGLSVAGLVAFLLVLAAVRTPANWPAPEATPYQGEAADPGKPGPSAVALARLVREPQNAWSNLAFVAGGAFLLVTRRTRAARTLGVPLVAVGIGSFLYHASASARLRDFDVVAMYWLLVLALAHCASLAWPKRTAWLRRQGMTLAAAALMLAVALTLARNVTVAGFKPLSLTVVTILASAGLLLTLADLAHRRESIAAALQLLGVVTVLGAAVFLQVGDRPGGRLYRPDAMVQPHAVWHVLAAIAFTWAITILDTYSTNETPAGSEQDSQRKG